MIDNSIILMKMAFSRTSMATAMQFCLFLTCTYFLALSQPIDPKIQKPLSFKMANAICEQHGKKMDVVYSDESEEWIDRLGSSDNITEAEHFPLIWAGVIYNQTGQMWVTNDGNYVEYNLDLMLNDTKLYANEACLAINITEFEIVDCTKELSFLCNSSDKEDFEARPSDLDSNPIPNPISSSTPNTTETYSDIETSHNSTSQTTDDEEEQDEQKINANSNTTNTTASNTETESEPAIPSSTSPTTILYDDQKPSSTPSTTTPNTTRNISENDCQIRINNKCYKYHINKPDTFKKANEICKHEHSKLARFENNEVITTLINNYLKHQYDHFWVVGPIGVTCMKTFWEDTFKIIVDSTHCKNNIFFICESGSEKFRLVRKRVKNDVATDECTRSGESLATIHVHGNTVIDNELIKVFKADKYWNTVTKEDLDRYSFSYSDAFWVGQEHGNLAKKCSKISFNQTATITDCEEYNMIVWEWEGGLKNITLSFQFPTVDEGPMSKNVTYDTPSSSVTTYHHSDLPHKSW